MSLTSRRSILQALAALAAPAFAQASTPSVVTTALAGTRAPGMAALVIRDFKAEPEQVAGIRRLGRPDSVAPGDRWHLGSDGKAMTATLIARLVERGVLAWDRPLKDLLPGLASTMRPEYRDVTLPDLMAHRAGLPENHTDTALFNTFYKDRASLTAQRLRYLAAALADPPVGPPRAAKSYSNTGLLLTAAAAEHATGRPFESLMADEVFRPLHMRTVSTDQYGGPHEPSGHIDGRLADQPLDPNPRMFAPAGGFRMSLSDWARFCIDQMRGEHGAGRLLKPQTYRFLHTSQGDTGAALGWGVQARIMGLKGPALTHSGSDGNWYAVVLLFPDTGAGVLAAANAGESMGGDKATVAALRALGPTVAGALPTT